MQQIMSSNVDLPLPEEPIIPMVSFLFIDKSKFLKISVLFWAAYVKVIFLRIIVVKSISFFV